MNLYTFFRKEIILAVKNLMDNGVLPLTLSLDRLTCEPPHKSQHGDVSTNAALILAKNANMSSADLAQKLLSLLQIHPFVQSVNTVAPGFINLSLKKEFWHERLREILKSGFDYGTSDLGQNQQVIVESPSMNPTGPLHMGHCRIAVVGDVMASILQKAGYKVIRESYINDAGGQALKLARSLYARYLQACGIKTNDPEDYKGEYLISSGQAIAKQAGNRWIDKPEDEWLEHFRKFAIDQMMILIQKDLALLGIHLDHYASEQDLRDQGKVQETFDYLEKAGLIYKGMLEAPKGKLLEDWEPREQFLFRSTLLGDDVDRPLKKSDGSWTYFAPDIAYHLDKYQRGGTLLINIFGADHAGYITRLTAAVQAITQNKASLTIKICQLVKFIAQGQVLKMSKRAGTFVSVQEAVQKVGKDAIRFIMLTRKNDAPLEFDFDQVVLKSKDNPVFYVQYAYARCHSIQRHIKETFPNLNIDQNCLATLDVSLLEEPEELQLIKILAGWPRQVEVAAQTFEPHRIAYYLLEVASAFHSLWSKGNQDSDLRFIFPHNSILTQQKFALIQSTAFILGSGFKLLGIDLIEEMR